MKTLYLHICTPKTATSSIQKFLAQNREVLESEGYVFPKSLHRYLNVNSRRNGHFLVRKVEKAEGGRDHELEKQYLQEDIVSIIFYNLITDIASAAPETAHLDILRAVQQVPQKKSADCSCQILERRKLSFFEHTEYDIISFLYLVQKKRYL